MLLTELVEGLEQNTVSQLVSFAHKMSQLYSGQLTNQLMNLYRKGEHEDMKRTASRVIGQTKGRWFSENYLGHKQTQGIAHILTALGKDSRFASLKGLIDQLQFEIQSIRSIRDDEKISYSKNLNKIADILPELLSGMGKVLGKQEMGGIATSAGRSLSNALTNFRNLWGDLHSKWEKEWGGSSQVVQPEEQPAAPAPDKALRGQQNAQVEQVVNNILKSLPANVAHEIRSAVARSDNKLATLQAEMKKRGLA